MNGWSKYYAHPAPPNQYEPYTKKCWIPKSKCKTRVSSTFSNQPSDATRATRRRDARAELAGRCLLTANPPGSKFSNNFTNATLYEKKLDS